ncbi:MAG: SCP2 sterol-binding domain-containing protein [Candidatus Hodarchaeales archaeon]|jgi:putative sterol carrier protein
MADPKEIQKKIADGTFSAADFQEFWLSFIEMAKDSDDVQDETENWDKKIQFDIGGSVDFWIKAENGQFSMGQGKIEDPDVSMIISEDDAIKMFAGQLDSTDAYLSGKLKIEGDLDDAQKFGSITQIIRDELEDLEE